MLEDLLASVVRNMPNFSINDVLESDTRLLMKLLSDKKSEETKEKKTVDFSKMSAEDVGEI